MTAPSIYAPTTDLDRPRSHPSGILLQIWFWALNLVVWKVRGLLQPGRYDGHSQRTLMGRHGLTAQRAGIDYAYILGFAPDQMMSVEAVFSEVAKCVA